MSQTPAKPLASSVNAEENAPSESILTTLLKISLTGVIVFKPVYKADTGLIVDLAYQLLNPAAQRMLNLPQQPSQTFLQLYPHAVDAGIFAFYRDTFLAGEPGNFKVNYQNDKLNNYFHLAAQRSEEVLVVSFTDTADQDRSAVEEALRKSQAREQKARAEAELQQQRLQAIFMAAPAMICLFEGPDHVFKLVNPPYQRLVGDRPLLGKPIAEAMPELTGQPVFNWLNQVYRTGESFYAHEILVQLDHDNSGSDLGHNYYNFIYQATRNPAGETDGIMVFAYEVTAQVVARQQIEYNRQKIQNLNEELQAINEELQSTNEEFFSTNEQLMETQQALQQLNEELEARVTTRTQELKQVQAQAEQERARLERFFMQAPAAICILDGPELVYELVNPGYQQLFPGRMLLGKPLLQALPELTNHTVWRTLQQVYQTGETHAEYGILIPVARYEGGPLEYIYFNYIQQARYDEQGRIDGVLVFAFEVTDQILARQMAEALQAEVLASTQRQSQERETFYQVFEQTPASIAILRGPEHCFQYINPGYQQLFPGRKLLNLPLAEALPEAVSFGFVALLNQVYQTGEPFFGTELPLQIQNPDGSLLPEAYFTFTYQAYRENNIVVGVSIFAFEVTNQVLTRREAEQQQLLLQRLFMDAPAPIVILDGPDLVYQLVNPAYQKIFPGRTLLGKPLLEALPELAGTLIFKRLSNVYQTGETIEDRELPLMLARYEGGPLVEIYWSFTFQARRNAQGSIEGVMVYAHEVTDQVKARQAVEESAQQAQILAEELVATNKELQEANQQLIRTNIDLDNFIYTASHDLKTPIINIEGLMGALLEDIPAVILQNPDIQQTTGLILDSVQRFKRTIEHLTEITKLQKENSPEALSINLAALIADVQLDLAPAIQATKAVVEVRVADCPVIYFTRKNLRSIIFNLLSNAIKYHSPERIPLVRVSCQVKEEYLVLSVEDNGLGINLAQQHKLFAMFSRLHTHVEGSGIGLYMVKKIIENAGGKIEVQSKEGEGSCFNIYFKKHITNYL